MLSVYGSLYEISDIRLDPIRPVNETGQRYVMLLFCFCLLLIYFVPFLIFLKWTCGKLKVNLMLPVMAFFSGWFTIIPVVEIQKTVKRARQKNA